ncbi:MAG: hypothetical protein LBQ12_13770 [Deltaproteobacteria bacterium]|jgi:hypothetical protein|nr:hypothetical protein [Deltaproteobacteria bacterium]
MFRKKFDSSGTFGLIGVPQKDREKGIRQSRVKDVMVTAHLAGRFYRRCVKTGEHAMEYASGIPEPADDRAWAARYIPDPKLDRRLDAFQDELGTLAGLLGALEHVEREERVRRLMDSFVLPITRANPVIVEVLDKALGILRTDGEFFRGTVESLSAEAEAGGRVLREGAPCPESRFRTLESALLSLAKTVPGGTVAVAGSGTASGDRPGGGSAAPAAGDLGKGAGGSGTGGGKAGPGVPAAGKGRQKASPPRGGRPPEADLPTTALLVARFFERALKAAEAALKDHNGAGPGANLVRLMAENYAVSGLIGGMRLESHLEPICELQNDVVFSIMGGTGSRLQKTLEAAVRTLKKGAAAWGRVVERQTAGAGGSPPEAGAGAEAAGRLEALEREVVRQTERFMVRIDCGITSDIVALVTPPGCAPAVGPRKDCAGG